MSTPNELAIIESQMARGDELGPWRFPELSSATSKQRVFHRIDVALHVSFEYRKQLWFLQFGRDFLRRHRRDRRLEA
jgi:hypothetical protein